MDICLSLTVNDLSFYDRKMQFRAEPGTFQIWVGSDSQARLSCEFQLQGSTNGQ